MGYTAPAPSTGTVGQIDTAVSIGAQVGGEVTKLIGGLFHTGSGYPKPVPPPLPYSVSQVAAMLQQSPTIYTSLVKHIHGCNPTDTNRVGAGSPSAAAAAAQASPTNAARIGLALADAQANTSGMISVGEANVRAVIQQGMYNLTPGGGNTVAPGGGTPQPVTTTPAKASTPALVGVALVGAVAAGKALHLL